MKKIYSAPKMIVADIQEDSAVMQASLTGGLQQTGINSNGKAVFTQTEASNTTQTVNATEVLGNTATVWDEDEDEE